MNKNELTRLIIVGALGTALGTVLGGVTLYEYQQKRIKFGKNHKLTIQVLSASTDAEANDVSYVVNVVNEGDYVENILAAESFLGQHFKNYMDPALFTQSSDFSPMSVKPGDQFSFRLKTKYDFSNENLSLFKDATTGMFSGILLFKVAGSNGMVVSVPLYVSEPSSTGITFHSIGVDVDFNSAKPQLIFGPIKGK